MCVILFFFALFLFHFFQVPTLHETPPTPICTPISQSRARLRPLSPSKPLPRFRHLLSLIRRSRTTWGETETRRDLGARRRREIRPRFFSTPVWFRLGGFPRVFPRRVRAFRPDRQAIPRPRCSRAGSRGSRRLPRGALGRIPPDPQRVLFPRQPRRRFRWISAARPIGWIPFLRPRPLWRWLRLCRCRRGRITTGKYPRRPITFILCSSREFWSGNLRRVKEITASRRPLIRWNPTGGVTTRALTRLKIRRSTWSSITPSAIRSILWNIRMGQEIAKIVY